MTRANEGKDWTKKDIARLKDLNKKDISAEKAAEILKRTRAAIYSKTGDIKENNL